MIFFFLHLFASIFQPCSHWTYFFIVTNRVIINCFVYVYGFFFRALFALFFRGIFRLGTELNRAGKYTAVAAEDGNRKWSIWEAFFSCFWFVCLQYDLRVVWADAGICGWFGVVKWNEGRAGNQNSSSNMRFVLAYSSYKGENHYLFGESCSA